MAKQEKKMTTKSTITGLTKQVSINKKTGEKREKTPFMSTSGKNLGTLTKITKPMKVRVK
jgi:hypothetical protein